MRLTTIKLSGFKSFVDPTTLHLPTNMTGVVGPNGCGKSNIIDAVRWVMGESSASRLRGDSLTDVIFSGSSSRKPVGQATVELIFDNSDGTVSGEFATYNEISVKRLVSRDGQSQYFLNGSRCRRRDITDLFLGTGLGPRSYSIIEQGMISQVIEARPEDLRIFLEEAAGISKYKERRKETETRIRHTRENLERLKDVRDEVDKQLEHLKRQARAAEQYQALKEEQRQKDAQLKALEYRRIDAQLGDLRQTLSQQETRLEEKIAGQRETEAQIETCRVQQAEAAELLARAQGEVYRVAGELARVEQQIAHQRELASRQQRARDEVEQAWIEVIEQLEADETQLAAIEAEIAAVAPDLASSSETEQRTAQELREAELALADWQARFAEHSRAAGEAARAAEVERTRIDFLDKQGLELGRRLEALRNEHAGLDLAVLEQRHEEMQAEHEAGRLKLDELGDVLEARKARVAEVQDQQRAQQHELSELRKQVQAARGRLASLEALQHAALGQEGGAGLAWVRARGLEQAPRLGEVLQVEPGWEAAVETVLGLMLEAVLVDVSADHVAALAELAEGKVALLDADEGGFDAPVGSLAALTRGPAAVRRLLAKVHVADDLAAAQAQLGSLPDAEWLITREGECIGAGWARVERGGDAHRGALAREREIHAAREQIESLGKAEADLIERQAELKDALLAAEQEREDAQRTLYLTHRNVAELSGQIQSHQGKLDAAQTRITRIEAELAQLGETSGQAQEQAAAARGRLETALERMGVLEDQRLALEEEREAMGARRDAARQAALQAREGSHQLAIALETRRATLNSLMQAVARLNAQKAQLQSRRTELAAQQGEGEDPMLRLEAERQTCLDQRVLVERDLGAARSALEGVEAELRRYEQQRQAFDQQALALREKLAGLRLEEQALALREQALAEAIGEAGLETAALLAELPEQADPDDWRRSLAEIEVRIRRLEPVNLAAISEYGEQSKRKEYLDAQHTDLSTALDTLEEAIRKIDKETRGRFKDTFDRVNAGVQELYPRLFGGGHAYLELTGEDLLDTGVSIMARPPGKRVSNISLLSGGEKALTAVALVFAIFRLNPAPFCLLDEVDAPLDEANVGRFCAMVTEMSEKVQFLFVSHNKATMEAAQQLCGVTMREPGVSRLVQVDLAEAARLAGAA
jgi:chromosome segregation protein